MLPLKGSNLVVNLGEIHLLSFFSIFTGSDTDRWSALCLFMTLNIAELAFTLMLKSTIEQVYAVSRRMTVVELRHPYKFAFSRIGSLLKYRSRKQRIPRSEKEYQQLFLEFEQVSFCSQIANVFRFMCCCGSLKDGSEP